MAEQHKKRTGSRGIQWTDRTIGAFGGCLHDCKWEMPDGTVAGCYAKSLAESGVARAAYPHGFEHHYFRPDAIKQLSVKRNPELIFVDSMSDMFAHNVPADQLKLVFEAMAKAPWHAFQSLTKAAPQILKYTGDLPANLWVGVSSPPDWMLGEKLSEQSQKKMLARSMSVLREVREKAGNIVWMSAEPVSWDLTTVLDESHPLDWIVIGAASNGPQYFQPDAAHVRSLLELMDATKTPVFFKGNIEDTFKVNDFGTPELNRWREDFPFVYRNGEAIAAVEARQEKCRKNGWPLSGQDKERTDRSLF
jgi:protein gp37